MIIADVITTTTLQRVVPNERVGSVFGILGGVSVIGMLLGSLLAPLMIEIFDLAIATAFAGGRAARRHPGHAAEGPIDRSAGRRASAASSRPQVALLERLGIFDGATPQQLEALAARVTRGSREAGDVVIREGDEPDDLFAIVSGSRRGAHGTRGRRADVVATLTEGDYFGEIGLLEKRPRTASVIAVTDSVLYRIPGEDFLRIVNEGPRVSPTLVSVVANRLAMANPDEELGRS